MRLIDDLLEHETIKNSKIVNRLTSIIKGYNINTLDDLKKYEDGHFPTDKIEDKLMMCYCSFVSDPTHIESSESNTLADVTKLMERFNSTNDIDEKSYCIIKMYELIDWELKLPYEAYKLIVEDKYKIDDLVLDNGLIGELEKHMTEDNKSYIKEISEIIDEYNIKNEYDLKELEDHIITKKGEVVSIEERIEFCRQVIDNNVFESDGLSNEELDKRYFLRKDMDNGTTEDMLLAAIKYFDLTNRESVFPYSTYLFILDGKL